MRCCQSLLKPLHSRSILTFIKQELTEKIIRINARRVDAHRLLKHLLRLLVATEADRKPGNLMVKRTETRIRRSVQSLGINSQSSLKTGARSLGQSQRSEPTLGAGECTVNDSLPDQRFGALGIAGNEVIGLLREDLKGLQLRVLITS